MDPCELASEDIEVVSTRRRAELARTFFAEADVVSRLGIDRATLVAWREARRLLAVWFPPDERYLYPPCQFDEAGLIVEIEPILQYLQPWLGNQTGWGEVEWLMTPHASLDGQTPVEALGTDRGRVLEVAATEFSEDPSTHW